MRIGIVIIATNAYFPLGIRFIKKFLKHYKGNQEIVFHFFSDRNPKEYLSKSLYYLFHETKHNTWVDATNSKFDSILKLSEHDLDYIYYFDADTNITKDFTESWFIGDMVGGQHYGDKTYMLNQKPYDRNPQSTAYIPEDTALPQMYFYGAFFGGKKDRVILFCKTLKKMQSEDKKINYEPAINDESYINKYFHHNRPDKTVYSKSFQFDISDKGGLEGTRFVNLDIEPILNKIKKHPEDCFDIMNGKVVL